MTLLLVKTGLDEYSAEDTARLLERHGIHASRIQIGHGFSKRQVEVEVSDFDVADVARIMETER